MKLILSILTILVFSTTNIFAQQNEKYVTRVINGKEYYIYTVKPGDTWESIAFKFQITERNLIDENKQTNGSLKGISSIKVPSYGLVNAAKTKKEKEAPVQVNTLPKFGDDFKNAKPTNLNTATKDDTTKLLPKIGENTTRQQPNNSKPEIFGQELRTEYKGANSLIVYRVGNNDKIENLALYYNCTPNDIISKNYLENNTLKPGKIIKIPVMAEPANNPNNNVTNTNNNDVVKQDSPIITKEEPVISTEKSEPAKNTLAEIKENIKEDVAESNESLADNEVKLGNYIVAKKLGRLFIKHKVISGEDLNRIAQENYSTSEKIAGANDIKNKKITAGQTLFIPTNKEILLKLTGLDYNNAEKQKEELIAKETMEANIVSMPKTENKNNTKQSINTPQNVKRDTSERYKWGDILIPQTDKLDSNAKKTAEDKAKEFGIKDVHANANAGETKETYTHVVMAGETIEGIAKKYKISVSDIANWNNLYQNKIRVGQDLIVNFNRARKPYLALNTVDPQIQNKVNKVTANDKVKYVEEKGLCLLTDDKFIGVAHKNAPVGTLLLVTSTENYKKIYLRVTSTLQNNDKDVILQIDKNIAKQLAFNSELSNVLISYSIIE